MIDLLLLLSFQLGTLRLMIIKKLQLHALLWNAAAVEWEAAVQKSMVESLVQTCQDLEQHQPEFPLQAEKKSQPHHHQKRS